MHVEEKGLVCRNGVFERAAKILRACDGERVDAAGSGPDREIGIVRLLIGALMKHGAMLAAAEHSELNVADGDPAEIVPNHPNHRDVVFNRGAEHMRNHRKAAVTGYGDDRSIRSRKLCAERTSGAETHAGKAPR